MDDIASQAMPDGIEAQHADPQSSRNVVMYRVLVVGALLLTALFGVVGGSPTRPQIVRSQAVELQVHVPNPIRNGMFVEWRIHVKARQPVADLVVAIPASLWQDMTINSLIPAASKERFEHGEFLFHFGAVDAGDDLLFKIDGQINPPRMASRQGAIRVIDGQRELASAPIDMRVVL
jgi:hypothetical protein